jgi:hypothetical protein
VETLEQIKQQAEAAAKDVVQATSKVRLYVLIGILVIAAGVFCYKTFAGKPVESVKAFVPSVPAHGMDNAPLHVVTPSVAVKAIDKQVAAKKMDLPAEVVTDSRKELLSTAYVPPSEGGHTTATVLDTDSEISTTIVREEPRPWYELGGKAAMGAGFGISTKGGEVIAVRARQDLLRLWSVNLSAEGEADICTAGTFEGRAMIWGEYRF